jgi:hypothetical protein
MIDPNQVHSALQLAQEVEKERIEQERIRKEKERERQEREFDKKVSLEMLNELKTQNIIKPTKQTIKKFKSEVVKIAKTAEEYNDIFKEDNDLVVFIRKNLELNPEAVDKFAQIFIDKGFNEMQIRYIRELLLFISQNGYFTRQVLLLEELNFKDLFNSDEIKLLIEEIESRM